MPVIKFVGCIIYRDRRLLLNEAGDQVLETLNAAVSKFGHLEHGNSICVPFHLDIQWGEQILYFKDKERKPERLVGDFGTLKLAAHMYDELFFFSISDIKQRHLDFGIDKPSLLKECGVPEGTGIFQFGLRKFSMESI
jgi:hypothetical protein